MLWHIMNILTMHAAMLIFESVFLGLLDYRSIFVSSTLNKRGYVNFTNYALICCLNILYPRDANMLEIHQQVNVQLFKHRMIVNLLLN